MNKKNVKLERGVITLYKDADLTVLYDEDAIKLTVETQSKELAEAIEANVTMIMPLDYEKQFVAATYIINRIVSQYYSHMQDIPLMYPSLKHNMTLSTVDAKCGAYYDNTGKCIFVPCASKRWKWLNTKWCLIFDKE